MEKKISAIPEGFNTLSSYISVNDAKAAIEFYKTAFGAKETGRINMPDGSVAHAELQIGDSKIMLAEENPQWGNQSPRTLGGSPVTLCIYVDDVDSVFQKALQAGAKTTGDMDVKDQFYGDRAGSLTDPFGHKWSIMTHKEDVSFEEMQKRMDAMFSVYK
ncbi:MAG TPA: VOC family protein [Prolixibacteraceae bacterium]|nr:VOC family protein [Prolixibacteraceae bacterium]